VIAVVAAIAVLGARALPVVGAPVIAIVVGMLARSAAQRFGVQVQPVAGLASRYLLQVAIVLFGTGLSVAAVLRAGLSSLPVMLGTLASCAAMAALAGRLMGVRGEMRILIASGTGICGASAIGAVAPVIAASETSVAYAMSTIVVFNLAAVALFPLVGHLLGLSQQAFGLWAGTAVNDTSSVTAAGYAYGHAAGDYAIVVKLTRTLMIIPLVLGLAARRRDSAAPATSWVQWLRRLVPPFLPLFLLAAAAQSIGLVPQATHPALSLAATYAVAGAMAGIGASIQLDELRRVGLRPLLLGAVLSMTVAVTGLALQYLI
jgi:uncharacterized integral membrane protein (TIGR00698 family)